MSKQSFYFSHDGNARNDDKIIAVRMRHGAEGYAVYFMILERLLESTNYMSVKDYNIIAFDLRVSAGIVKSVIEDFGLFQDTEDGRHFMCERFSDRMRPLDNLREQRRIAGLKSAESRAKAQQKTDLLPNNSTTVERPLNENPTEERIKSKEDKKEMKKTPTNVGAKVIDDDVPDFVKKNRARLTNELNFDFKIWAESLSENYENSPLVDLIAIENSISKEAVLGYLEDFYREKTALGNCPVSKSDANKWLKYWLKIQVANGQKGKIAKNNELIDQGTQMLRDKLKQELYGGSD